MNESHYIGRKSVVSDILDRNRTRDSLVERDVKREVPDLHDRAIEYFGSWQVSLRHAGVRPAIVESYSESSSSEVVRVIRYLCHKDACLKTQHVRINRNSLYDAALRHFGSWLGALKAAGINTMQVSSHTEWGRDKIIESILLRAVERRSLGASKVRPLSLKSAAVKEFGSWELALRAAGLDPSEYIWRRPKNCRDEPTGRKWNGIRVIKLIRQREVLGLPLDKNAVSRDNRPLVRAARAYFGDWTVALEVAFAEQTDQTSA